MYVELVADHTSDLYKITRDGKEYNARNYMNKVCGIVELYSQFDTDCGGCSQEVKVTDLLHNNKCLLYLGSDYNWGYENPTEDPFRYIEGIKVEVYDTPLHIIEIQTEWFDNFEDTSLYKELAEKSKMVLTYYDDFPYYYFLRWEETSKTKIVDVFDAAIFEIHMVV